MARTEEHHRKLNDQGEGKCSVPMWMGGCPAGFCDERAFGERPPSREYRNGHTGRMQRFDGRYDGYVPGLACPAHGGPSVRVYMDGNMFCAVRPDFVNLQESPAGFGATKEEAIAELESRIGT